MSIKVEHPRTSTQLGLFGFIRVPNTKRPLGRFPQPVCLHGKKASADHSAEMLALRWRRARSQPASGRGRSVSLISANDHNATRAATGSLLNGRCFSHRRSLFVSMLTSGTTWFGSTERAQTHLLILAPPKSQGRQNIKRCVLRMQ